MSNQETFNDLFSCIKILERNQLTIPSVGFQRKYNLTKEFLEDEKFGLIINRKGHLNAENLTYEDVKRLINEINRFVLYEKNYNSHILAKTEQFFLNNSKINVNLSKKYNKMLLHIYNIKLNENNLRCLR